MSNKFNHRGYKATVEYSPEDHVFVGRVLDIDALVLFSGFSVDELTAAFVQSVNDYLQQCEKDGIAPQKPCSGTFNVRVGADVHRRALSRASELRLSLNEFVKASICNELDAANRGRAVRKDDEGSTFPSHRVVPGGIPVAKAWEDQQSEVTYGVEASTVISSAHAEVRRH